MVEKEEKDMAVRKAFIDWKKLDGDTALKNRKEYLLAVPMDSGEASLDKAVYYEKGTVIDIPLKDGALPSGKAMTAEERLLVALFGAGKPFVVPEDGFWKVTADYGVDEYEKNGAFAGCREQAVCLGNRRGWGDEPGGIPVWWTEMPILPKGDRPERQEAVKPEGLYRDFGGMLERIQSDPIAASAYKYFCGDASDPDAMADVTIGQAVYSLTAYSVAMALDSAWAMCRALAEVPEEAVLELRESMDGVPVDTAAAAFESFCGRYAIPAARRRLVFCYADYLREDCDDFYHYRDKLMSAGGLKSLNMPAVLQESWARASLPWRVGRLTKLTAMGCPDVILANELRVLAERLLAIANGRSIVCVGPGFDAMYGVMPDGSRGSRHCEWGDKELQLIPEEKPDADPGADAEEAVEMELPGEEAPEAEKPEPIVGVDYPWFAVVPSPNFLMRKCRYVLWDNTGIGYVRDKDGEIVQFQDWKAAKSAADMLAEDKKGQA